MNYNYYLKKHKEYTDQLDQIMYELSMLPRVSIWKRIKLFKKHKEIWFKLDDLNKKYSDEWRLEIEKCY